MFNQAVYCNVNVCTVNHQKNAQLYFCAHFLRIPL